MILWLVVTSDSKLLSFQYYNFTGLNNDQQLNRHTCRSHKDNYANSFNAVKTNSSYFFLPLFISELNDSWWMITGSAVSCCIYFLNRHVTDVNFIVILTINRTDLQIDVQYRFEPGNRSYNLFSLLVSFG